MRWGYAYVLFELPSEVFGILVSTAEGNVGNGFIGGGKVFTGCLHTTLNQIMDAGNSKEMLVDTMQISIADVKIIGHL